MAHPDQLDIEVPELTAGFVGGAGGAYMDS